MSGLEYASLSCRRWFTWKLCLHYCLSHGIQNKADPQQTEEESQMRYQPVSKMVCLQYTLMAYSPEKGQKWLQYTKEALQRSMKVCFQDFPHIPCLWHYKEKSPLFISGLVKCSMAGGTVLGNQQCSARLTLGVCTSCGLYLLLWICYLQLQADISFTMEADTHKSHRTCLDSRSSL